ncbi:MAG: DUF4118 domain-containing protein [Chloroflexi bacterium]|nr:MAG: DUF4118 domain-containing protein [Chloroflexota bacterium]
MPVGSLGLLSAYMRSGSSATAWRPGSGRTALQGSRSMSTVIPVPDPCRTEDDAPVQGLATERQQRPSNASSDYGLNTTAVSCTAPKHADQFYQQGSRRDGDGRWSDLAKRHLSNSGFLPWAVPVNGGMLLLLGLYAVFHDVFKPMPSLPVFTVIMLSSWLGGRASGILATALGALLIAFAYLPPDDSLEVAWPDGVLLLGGFIGLGILMSIVIASVDSSKLKREVKRSVPSPLKNFYRATARVFSTSAQPLRARDIDLERTLIGGYNAFTAGEWADLVGEPRCASMMLGDSPHVRFLEDYRRLGEAVFEPAAT